jgi:hypothetical protein
MILLSKSYSSKYVKELLNTSVGVSHSVEEILINTEETTERYLLDCLCKVCNQNRVIRTIKKASINSVSEGFESETTEEISTKCDHCNN